MQLANPPWAVPVPLARVGGYPRVSLNRNCDQRKHAKICWGEEVVAAADNTRDVRAAREALEELKLVDGSITAAFEQIAKSKVTYSHCQHTTSEAWYVFHWSTTLESHL